MSQVDFEDRPPVICRDPNLSRPSRPRVSLCMIVKNEGANLPTCLGSAADLVDEIIIVDTGSTDRTREISRAHGARVVDFAWVDDFSAARNAAVAQATGQWIFWLDGDEWLDGDNRQKFRALLAGLPAQPAVFLMRQQSLPGKGGSLLAVDQVRLFPNRPELRWQYRVHENILLAVRRAGFEVRQTDIRIMHSGYQDAELSHGKLLRNLRLLELQDREQPDDPITLFYLGWANEMLNRLEPAARTLRRGLELTGPKFSARPRLFALLARVHHRGRELRAALATCRAGLAQYPENTELLFLEALVRHEQGDQAGAEAALIRLLESPPPQGFSSGDLSLRGPKARFLLGQVYQAQGREVDAEAQWQAVLAEQPRFARAWLALGDLYLAGGRWDALGKVADNLDPEPGLELRARACLARKEYAAARALLEPGIAGNPNAWKLHLLWARMVLAEGKDPAGAEQALQRVLFLVPGQPEAQDRLGILRGKSRAASLVHQVDCSPWVPGVPSPRGEQRVEKNQ